MEETTMQISLRLDAQTHDSLKRLSRVASVNYNEDYSVQDLIRKAIDLAYDKLVELCERK